MTTYAPPSPQERHLSAIRAVLLDYRRHVAPPASGPPGGLEAQVRTGSLEAQVRTGGFSPGILAAIKLALRHNLKELEALGARHHGLALFRPDEFRLVGEA